MSENGEVRPPSPKEDLECPPKEDSGSLSEECDTDQTVPEAEKAEKENSDDIGGELDYEEEIVQFPSQDDFSDDKKEDIKPRKVKERDVEEGEDEGEISGEEDDLEEGELKDGTPSCETSQSSRQICRFFTRGQCYYGTACRFLHLTNSSKGQYNMFARYPDGYYGASMNMMMCDRAGPRTGIDYMGSIPPPMQIEQSPVESAWERGLREAKELVKKANKRKEEEPDFDKKKNYLSINFNEKNTDFDKENDYLRGSYSSKRNPPETSYKKNARDCDYDDTQRSRDHLRGGPPPRFENFEVHYTHSRGDDMMQRMNFDRRERTRERSRGRASSERGERYASKERNRDRNKVKDDLFHVQMRTRAFEYVDPWRRSKTPKARGGRSRSGSYSSVSSSYSDRSSRSASGLSYSRSSSRSSGASSRSPSMRKRKSPGPEAPGFSKTSSNRIPPVIRKKPGTARSPSFSSRSRSVSTAPSVSRSRSYSRSISMDSVSSDSSCVSHSSCESLRKKNGNSLLRKKSEEKLPLEKLEEYREELARGEITESYPEIPVDPASGFTSYLQFLPDDAPGTEKAKSQPPHKQQIKLTLLNKPSTSKITFPKKELDRSKLLPESKSEITESDPETPVDPAPGSFSYLGFLPDDVPRTAEAYSQYEQQIEFTAFNKPSKSKISFPVKNLDRSKSVPEPKSGKRPLSPPPSALKPDPVLAKKSASSRRDELLKQLKAVEAAIARKKVKLC